MDQRSTTCQQHHHNSQAQIDPIQFHHLPQQTHPDNHIDTKDGHNVLIEKGFHQRDSSRFPLPGLECLCELRDHQTKGRIIIRPYKADSSPSFGRQVRQPNINVAINLKDGNQGEL